MSRDQSSTQESARGSPFLSSMPFNEVKLYCDASVNTTPDLGHNLQLTECAVLLSTGSQTPLSNSTISAGSQTSSILAFSDCTRQETFTILHRI